MLTDGEVSRVAKGADCKSAAVWLRRFESFLPHQPSLAKRDKAATPKPNGRRGAVAASYGWASHPSITDRRANPERDRSSSPEPPESRSYRTLHSDRT